MSLDPTRKNVFTPPGGIVPKETVTTTVASGCSLNLYFLQLALLLIQHYCGCGKPTVTDGNLAIIYCNSLRATKMEAIISKHTTISGTDHNA